MKNRIYHTVRRADNTKTNGDQQNSSQETKDSATQTPLNRG